MHKGLWFLAGAVVAAGALAAYVFLAGPHGRGHHKFAEGKSIERSTVMAKHDERFGRLDSDGDGSIGKAEWDSFHGGRFDAVDSDKDGTLSAEEIKAARKAHWERRGEES